MAFAKSLLVLLLIPLLGFGLSQWLFNDINGSLQADGANFTITELCADAKAVSELGVVDMCSRMTHVGWMRTASIGSAVVGVLLLLLFVFASSTAGTDRKKMTRIFPPLVVFSLIALALLVLVHGAILTYAVFLGEVLLIGRYHIFLIGGVGIGALIGFGSLIKASSTLAGKREQQILGQQLSRDKHPAMFEFASGIAGKLGAREPDNIVVGLDPNFFVTSADVQLIGTDKELTGETLYLSLPLARIFTRDEIRAVIGHELGHFRGNDTAYSLRFAPVYAGLTHGVNTLGASGDLTAVAQLPARSVLRYMIETFHRNVSTISREREFEADKAALEVAPAQSLATSLLKIGLYANAWGNLQSTVVERMGMRKFTRNMSSLFASIVRYDVNVEKIPEAIDGVAKQTVSHPTDSHPPTATRIEQAGLRVEDIDHADLLVDGGNSIDLIDGHLEIEEELTSNQQKMYVSMGVQVPEAELGNQGGLVLAALGAHMVLADGVVDREEIDLAEGIGRQISEHFDYIEFREFCHYPDSLPSVDELLKAVGQASDDGKSAVSQYLKAIAEADEQTSPEEQALLDALETI
ncbi:MAG: M48 family metalloprotease [Gammaproteobacteria bacterium]